MLTPASFIEQCRACLANRGGPDEIAALTKQALVAQRRHPSQWAVDDLMHRADDLMIVNLTLPPFTLSAIHDHGTWAVVGIAEGCEVEHLYEQHGRALVKSAELEVRAGETLVLGAATIHAVSNPLPTPARGIHVYGKDLIVTQRRMWHPDTGAEMAMHLPTFEQWERELTAANQARRSDPGR